MAQYIRTNIGAIFALLANVPNIVPILVQWH